MRAIDLFKITRVIRELPEQFYVKAVELFLKINEINQLEFLRSRWGMGTILIVAGGWIGLPFIIATDVRFREEFFPSLTIQFGTLGVIMMTLVISYLTGFLIGNRRHGRKIYQAKKELNNMFRGDDDFFVSLKFIESILPRFFDRRLLEKDMREKFERCTTRSKKEMSY